jgi:hypothetical protein
MFGNSPRNHAPADTDSSTSFQALPVYNALLRVFGFAPLAMTAQNEETAADACQNLSEELAKKIGAEKTAEVLSDLSAAENLDDFTSTEEKIAIAYLRTDFEITKAISDDEQRELIASQPKQMRDADTNTEIDQVYKRKIKTTHDAVLALYQLIDEILPNTVDLAATLARAADIFDKKTQQPTVYTSIGISEKQIEDEKLINRYNTLMLALVHNPTLSNTASNVEFAKKAFAHAKNRIYAQAKEDLKRQLKYPIAESKENEEEDAANYPEVTFYNTLRQHFNYPALMNTEENNVLSRNILANITAELSHQFGKDKAPDILVDLINNQDGSAQITPAEKHQALDHLQTYFENKEIEKLEQVRHFIITQPELILSKSKNGELTDIETRCTTRLSAALREENTPIHQYNKLLKLFFDHKSLPPLSDTESNYKFATDALQAITRGVTEELALIIPPISAAKVSAFIDETVSRSVITHSSANASLINNSLHKHIALNVHKALLIYNVGQRYFLFEPLENTVENDQLAHTALQLLKQQVGDEKLEEILAAMENNPEELEAKNASDETKQAVDRLSTHYAQTNIITARNIDRPTFYTRHIVQMLEINKDVSRHEKMLLLKMLSSLILKRQQSIAEKLAEHDVNTENDDDDDFESNDLANIGAMTTDLEPLLASHNAAMIEYLRETADISVAELGINIIKQLYALHLGAEEPEFTFNATPPEPVVEEEKVDSVVATAKATTPTTSEPDDNDEEENQKKYPRQPKSVIPTTRTLTSESDDEFDTDEARQEDSSPLRGKGERISLADEIRQTIEANRSANEIARRKERETEQQRESERLALTLEQQRNEEEQQKNADEQERLSFAAQLRNTDAMPAGYLSKPRKFNSLMDDMEEAETKTQDIHPSASSVLSAPDEDQEEEKQEFAFVRRVYDTAPNLATISNSQAMLERMHEYAMNFIPPRNERKKVADHIQTKMVAAFQEKISLLMELISASCAAAGVQVMKNFNTALTQMFVMSNQREAKISFDHLYVLQTGMLKEASAYTKSSNNENIKKMIANLNEATIEKKLISAVGGSCQHIMLHGEGNEKELAKTLLKKSTDFLKASAFNKDKFLGRMIRASELADLCQKPTPTEKIAQDFIKLLTLLYAGKNEALAQNQLAVARLASAASPEEADAAKLELLFTEANLQTADAEVEQNLKDEFKKFFGKMTKLGNTNQKQTLTPEAITARTEEFTANFFKKINSSRLQTMRHITMIILENLEQLHEAAASDVHQSKGLFDEYRGKIWGIRLDLSDATVNEIELKRLLGEFLEKTDHQIAIQIGGRDLIHLEPSAAEDQRLRLLTSGSHYLQSLTALKDRLAEQYAPRIVPIIAELKAAMQTMLALDFSHQADKQKIVQLRSELEHIAAGWESNISQIIQENKRALVQPIGGVSAARPSTTTSAVTPPLSGPGNLSILEEARRKEQALADRQKTLASIFKTTGPKQ